MTLEEIAGVLVHGTLPIAGGNDSNHPAGYDEIKVSSFIKGSHVNAFITRGNVSKEGITADLEWMHRVGIGGMQMFDGDLGHLDKPVIWMTPEWKDAFHHAGAETDRLGFDLSMAASGGWSETAGPWTSHFLAFCALVKSATYTF
jgi:alpha-L-rhamnosidase